MSATEASEVAEVAEAPTTPVHTAVTVSTNPQHVELYRQLVRPASTKRISHKATVHMERRAQHLEHEVKTCGLHAPIDPRRRRLLVVRLRFTTAAHRGHIVDKDAAL